MVESASFVKGFVRSVFDYFFDVEFVLKQTQFPLLPSHFAHIFLILTGFELGNASGCFSYAIFDDGISELMAREDEIVDFLALGDWVCFANDFTVEFVDDSVVDKPKLF